MTAHIVTWVILAFALHMITDWNRVALLSGRRGLAYHLTLEAIVCALASGAICTVVFGLWKATYWAWS